MVVFRQGLRDVAQRWFTSFPRDVRTKSYSKLKELFIEDFKIHHRPLDLIRQIALLE